MTDAHLSVDELSDLLAGEAPETSTSHLTGCAHCRSALAELEAAMARVSDDLASLPAPPEPLELNRRIRVALEAERGSGGVQPQRGRGRAWLTAAAGIAAAAALLLGGLQLAGPSSSKGDAQQGTVTAADAPPRTSTSRLDYGKDGRLLAAQLPVLLGAPAAERGAAAPAPQEDSRTGEKAAGGAATELASPADPAADPLGPLRTTPGLASCLAALSEGQEVLLPLALDYASFEGKPALVVVLPSSRPDRVDVFVVGAGCSQADAQLLYFSRLAKP